MRIVAPQQYQPATEVIDQANGETRIARAAVESARANVALAKLNLQRATVRAPCGEPSSVTSTTLCPISSAAVWPGEAVVALANTTVGSPE